MKKLISLLSIALIATAMVGCGGASSPSDVANAYYTALEKGDFEKAMSYAALDESDIPVMVGKLEGMAQEGMVFKGHKILSETIAEDGMSATLEVEETTVRSKGEEPVTEKTKLKLVNVDGKWLIKIF